MERTWEARRSGCGLCGVWHGGVLLEGPGGGEWRVERWAAQLWLRSARMDQERGEPVRGMPVVERSMRRVSRLIVSALSDLTRATV